MSESDTAPASPPPGSEPSAPWAGSTKSLPSTHTVWDYVTPTASPTPSAAISASTQVSSSAAAIVAALPGITGAEQVTPDPSLPLAASVAAVAGSEARTAIANAHDEASQALHAQVAERATATAARVPEPAREAAQTAYRALPAEQRARLEGVAENAAARAGVTLPLSPSQSIPVSMGTSAPSAATARTNAAQRVPHYATLANTASAPRGGRGAGIASVLLAVIAGIAAFGPIASYVAVVMSIIGWILAIRARRAGSIGLGTTGLVLSILAFVASAFFSLIYTLFFALTS